jgi:hypothetical protein
VKRASWSAGLSVAADGSGVVAHAGSVALRLLADRTGLTSELSRAMHSRSFTRFTIVAGCWPMCGDAC